MLQWILVRLKPGAGLFGCDSIRKFSHLLDISGPNFFRASHSWPHPEIATANPIPISPVRFFIFGDYDPTQNDFSASDFQGPEIARSP